MFRAVRRGSQFQWHSTFFLRWTSACYPCFSVEFADTVLTRASFSALQLFRVSKVRPMNQKDVNAIKPGPRRILWDDEVPGLGLQVTAGAVSYIVNFRVNGKMRRHAL